MEKMKPLLRYWESLPKSLKTTVFLTTLLIGTFEMRAWLSKHADATGPRFLILARDMEAGERIQFSDLKTRMVPLTDVQPEVGSLTDQQLPLVEGTKILASIKAGSFLQPHLLDVQSVTRGLGAKVPKGYRAMGLRVYQSVPVYMGDKVDVLVQGSSEPVVESVPVLAVRKDGTETDVVLAVHPSDMDELQKVSRNGNASLVVRNPEDKEAPAPKKRSKRHKPASSRIEILSEGA